MNKPRNIFFKAFAVLVLFCTLLPICSCSNDPFGTMVPQGVSIRQVSPSSPDIRNASVRFSDVENQVFTLEAEVTLRDGSTNKDVVWKVPERGVTIHDSSNGALTFTITDVGTYTFTASARYNGSEAGVTSSVTVNVMGALTSLGVRKEGTTAIADSISVSMTDTELTRLIPVFTPEDSTQKDVSWEFSSNDFFTLSQEQYLIADTPNQGETLNTALIRPLAAGTGTVTLRSTNNPDIYKEVTIIVRAAATEQETPATSLVFNQNNIVLPIGADKQMTLAVTVTDGYGNVVTTGKVEFESSDPETVKIMSSVDRQVSIQAFKAGSALITATYTTEDGSELMATVNVTTKGAIERISTDSSYYSFVVGTTTGPDDIKLFFTPEDTEQKSYTVIVDKPEVASVLSPAGEDYVALRILKAGETDVTITSGADTEVSHTFKINAVDELSASDKINKLTIDRTSLTFNPPFAGQEETLSVKTRVYADNTRENTIEGDYATYGLRWDSSNPEIAMVTDNGDGTATVQPVAPGEATITATSVVAGEEQKYQVSCHVSVTGSVESLIPDASKVSVISGGSYELRVTPYPTDAILAEDDSGAKTGVVTFSMDDNTTASASYTLNSYSNVLLFTITGIQPGTTALNIMVDGKEMLSVPVAVTAKDDRYLSKLVFDTSSSIIAQDAGTVEHTLMAYDQNGEEMDISYENVEYTIVEDGNTYTSFGNSRHVDIWTDGKGNFTMSPLEPGVTTVRAAAIGNTSGVSAALRVEVGGAATHDDLIDIRVTPEKLQIKEGYTDEVSVSFIPYSYGENHDLSIDWDVIRDDDGENVTITRQSDESVTIRGNSVGTDIVSGIHNESRMSPSFTVEVVGKDEDAYKIVLDKSYLSFDRNQKEPPAVTATVYKNGRADDSLVVDWKFAASENRFITKNDNGNTTYVSMSEFEDETGSTYLTAEFRLEDEVVAAASCYVEVIDSSAAPELRAITTEYSSLMMSMNEGMVEVDYEVVPDSLKDDIELQFSYDRNGIVSAEQDRQNGTIRIIPLSAGTVNVTIKDKASDVSTSMRITVEDYQKPEIANLAFDRSSLVMAMDSNGEMLTVTGTDQYGDRISVRGQIGFSIIESGDVKDVDGRLNYVKAIASTDSIYIEPFNSGIATVRAYLLDNDEIYADCRVEIGGAAIADGLTALIPTSSYMQINKGDRDTAGVIFIPSTYENQTIEWSSAPDAGTDIDHTSFTGSADSTEISIKGDELGKDVYTAKASAAEGRSTIFTVEVVDSDAYKVVLDTTYISYDLAAKAVPTITATVYKNGMEDDSAEIEWKTTDTEGLVTVKGKANTATVSLSSTSKTGDGRVAAYVKGTPVFAECFVEVVDSSNSTKLRSVSFENASVNMYAGDIHRMGYSILPESQYETVDLAFSASTRGIVEIEQDKENREIVIRGLDSGLATITVTATNSIDQTKATGRFTVRVNKPIGNPRYIELDQTYLELSQEDMDRTFYVNAKLMDYSGNQVTGTDSRITWEVEKGGERFITWSAEGGTFIVTPLSAGEVKVTCSFPGLDSETLTITIGTADAVYGKNVSMLIPSTDKVVMEPEGEMDLWVSLAPNGNAKDIDLEWASDNDNVIVESSSSDPAVATVRISSAATEGESANITVSDRGSLSAKIVVEVKENTADTVTAVMLDPQVVILDLDAKDLTRFTAKLYKNGEQVDANNRIAIDTSGIEDYVTLANTSTSGVLDIVKKAEGSGVVTFRSTEDSDMTVRAYVDVVRSSTLEKVLNSVVLSSSARTMMIGEAYDITATVVPMSLMEQADKPVFSFESGNGSVAEIVSEDGASARIVGRGTGTTDITVTATYGDVTKSASMKVTVPADAPRITHVELDRNSVALDQFKAEEWTDVTATVMSTSGATSFDVKWNIPAGADNLMEYEVNGNTLSMRPLSAGNVRITAEYNGYTAELNVSTGEEKSIYGEITGLEPSVNGTVQLLRDRSFQVWVTPIGGSIMPELKWEAEGNVTVEQNPYNVNYATVKAGSTDGTGTVTATIEESGVQAVFSFNVSEFGTGEVSAVTVKPSKLVLDLDAKALPQFTATSYVDGTAVDTHSFTWTIDEASAVLDDFADIRGTGSQNATGILSVDTARADVTTGFVRTYADAAESAYARAVIEVVRSSQIETGLQDIMMSVPENVTMTVGQTMPVRFTAIPSSLTSETEFTMESGDPSLVSVYGSTLTALAVTADPVTITVRAVNDMTEKFATIQVSVVDNPAPASYIVIESGNRNNGIIEVANGGNTTATATLYDTHDEVVDNAALTWDVENPGVAKVTLTENGRRAQIDALINDSSTKFTVSSGEIEAEGYILVGEAGDLLIGLIANPSAMTIAINEKAPFTITPVPSSVADATELTFQAENNSFRMEEDEVTGEYHVVGLSEGSGALRVMGTDGISDVETEIDVRVSGILTPSRVQIDRSSVTLTNSVPSVDVTASVISEEGKLFDGDVTWLIDDESVAKVEVDPADPNKATVIAVGAGQTVLKASYEGLMASIPVTYSYVETIAKVPTGLYALSGQIILDNPATEIEMGDPALVTESDIEIGFTPNNLGDDYKTVTWTLSGTSIEIDTAQHGYETGDRTTANGKLAVRAVKEGETTVRATSTIDPTKWTEVKVIVLPAGVRVEGGIPTLDLDKTRLVLEADGTDSADVTATLTEQEGGEMVDGYADLEWKMNPENVVVMGDVDQKTKSFTSIAGKAGKTYLTVSYPVKLTDGSSGLSVDRSIAIESIVTADAGKTLSAVLLDRTEFVMIVGDTEQLEYTLNPNIPDASVSWLSDNGTIAEVDANGLVTAKAAGTARITITAKQVVDDETITVEDSVKVTVLNGVPESSKYSGFEADTTVLSLTKNGGPGSISYTLLDSDGQTNVNDQITRIDVYGINGYHIATYETADFTNSSDGVSRMENDYFRMETVGDRPRSFTVYPLKSGTFSIQAWVLDDPNDETKGGVGATTLLSISGDVEGAGISTNYIHMAEGDTEVIEISFNPSSAVLSNGTYKWEVVATDGDNGFLTVSDQTITSATIRANKIGEGKVVYTYTENNVDKVAEVQVLVEDRASLSGGVKKIAFPTSYTQIDYPYPASEHIEATVSFFDGTTTNEDIEYYISDSTGKIKLSGVDLDAVTSKIAQLAYYSSTGVDIIPQGPGTFYLTASCKPVGATEAYTATMQISVRGAINALITSHSKLVLYTGGSTEISVTPDDENAPGASYVWNVISEKKLNPTTGAVDDSFSLSSFPSALEQFIIMDTTDSSSIVIGAKDVITDKTDGAYNQALAESYPRRVTVEVRAPQYDVSTEITIDVLLLSAENYYPKALEMNVPTTSIDVPDSGSFTQDDRIVVTATVTDREGNEIDANVDWYFYPIGNAGDSEWWVEQRPDANGDTYKKQSWIDPDNHLANPYIDAYLDESTGEMSFIPTQSGQYRLKAIVRENPYLQKSQNIYVGGAVNSISVQQDENTVNNVNIIKDASTTLNVVFNPMNALAGDPIWILRDQRDNNADADDATAMDIDLSVNDHVSLTQTGRSVSVLGKEVTEGTSAVTLVCEYYDDSLIRQNLQDAIADGKLTLYEYREATKDAKSGQRHSAVVYINVLPKDMTIMTLSISDLPESIDPSSVTSAIPFTVTATASGADPSMTFSNWDWLDVEIRGADSGLVYATTKMIEIPVDPTNPDGQKKKVAAWQYNTEYEAFLKGGGDVEDFVPSLRYPIAENGMVNHNDNRFSFVLNPNGVPTEPVNFVVSLREDYAEDGIDENGYKLFDVDTLRFADAVRLCYIGGRVTSITAATTTYNLNNNVQNSEGSNVDMIMGASAVLTIEYNPTYTHQKGVVWYAPDNTGYTNFQAINGEGKSQCSVFGRTATVHNNEINSEKLRAVSVFDPWFSEMASAYEAAGEGTAAEWREKYYAMSNLNHIAEGNTGWFRYPKEAELTPGLYYDYQITVQSLADEIKFIATSQAKNGTSDDNGVIIDRPGYYTLTDTAKFPPVESVDEVYCYDSSGTAGVEDKNHDGLVDNRVGEVAAYLVDTRLSPNYGYSLNFEIVDGLDIGYLDDYEIDPGSNQFRFVPNGPRYTNTGDIFINYGDVTISATVPDLNIKKSFVLHYLPSNIKLVSYIGEGKDGKGDDMTVPEYWNRGVRFDMENTSDDLAIAIGDPSVDDTQSGYWDVYQSEKNPDEYIIEPLQTIVLYPGEEFDLSAIAFFNNKPQYIAAGVDLNQSDESEDVDHDEKFYAISYYLSEKPGSMMPVEDYIEFIYESEDYDDRIFLDNEYSDTDGRKAYPENGRWVDDDGQSDWIRTPKSTIRAPKDGKQGRVYLNYTIAPIKEGEFDPSNPTAPIEDTIDNSQRINGGLWVYISEPVDQLMAVSVANQRSKEKGGQETPISVKLANSKLSLAQLRPPVIDGKEYPSHWFMGEYGFCADGDIGLSTTRFYGTAYLSFSQNDVSLTGIAESGIDGTATPLSTIKYDASDNALVISSDNLPSPGDIDENFRGIPSFSHMDLFGEFGLPKLPGVTAINVIEDGTADSFVNVYLDEKTGVLDFTKESMPGADQLRFYRHSGIIAKAKDDVSDFGSLIKTIIPPANLIELRLPDDQLNCDFRFSEEAKRTLQVLDLSENYFDNLTIRDLDALEYLNLSGDPEINYNTYTRRFLNVIGCDKLKVVNLDDTLFQDVVIEFRKAPGRFYDPKYDAVLSARMESQNNATASSSLSSLTLSGSIGIVDVRGADRLESIILTSEKVHELTSGNLRNTDQYQYVEGSEDYTWIQQLITGYADGQQDFTTSYGPTVDSLKTNADGEWDYRLMESTFKGAVRNQYYPDNVVTRESIYNSAMEMTKRDATQSGNYYLTGVGTDLPQEARPILTRIQLVRLGMLFEDDSVAGGYDWEKFSTNVFEIGFISKFCDSVYFPTNSSTYPDGIPYVGYDVSFSHARALKNIDIMEIGDWRGGDTMVPARVSFREGTSIKNVHVGSLFGEIHLDDTGVTAVAVNDEGTFKDKGFQAAGSINVSGTPITSLGSITGYIEGLSIDRTKGIKTLRIESGTQDRLHYLKSFSADGSGLRNVFIAGDSMLEYFSAASLTDGFSGTMDALGNEGKGSMALVIMPREKGGLKEIDIHSSKINEQSWRIGNFTYRAVRSSDKVVGAEAINGGYPIGHEAGTHATKYYCKHCGKYVSKWSPGGLANSWTGSTLYPDQYVCQDCYKLITIGDVREVEEKDDRGTVKTVLVCQDCGKRWTNSISINRGGDEVYRYMYMDRDSDGDAYSRYKYMYGCSTCYSRGPVRFEETVAEVQNTWFAMRSKQNNWTLTATTMGEGPVIDYQEWLPQLKKMTAYGNGICFHAYYDADWSRRVTIDVTAKMRLGEGLDNDDLGVNILPIAYVNGYGSKGWVDEKGKTVQNWIYANGKQVAYGSASCDDTSANWVFGSKETPADIGSGDLVSVRFRTTNGEEYTSMNLLVFPFGQ